MNGLPLPTPTTDLVSAALVAAQGEMPAATFDATNPFLRNRYASLGAVIAASRPVLHKHGLAILQVPTATDTAVQVHTRIIHKSGQSLDGGCLALPLGDEKGKSRAQVAGSIVTYLRRYAWASVLGMYSDEDTDGNDPERPQTRSAPRQATSVPPAPAEAPQAKSDAGKGVPKATAAFRMRALNKLQGAPGQSNRPLIQHFLQVKGWIKPDQAPEEWPLEHVPATQPAFDQLWEEIQRFEIQQRQPNAVSGEEKQ